MRVTFVSNYINHHQIPVSTELYACYGEGYTFIQTEPMEQERVQMGWNPDTNELPYLRLFEEDPEGAMQLIMDSDMVIFGGTDEESFIQPRLKAGKPVIRYSERIYKTGQWKFVSPRGLKKKYLDHTRYRNAQVYLLCSGAYVASDFNLVLAYPNKKLKWGYFPAFVPSDVDNLMEGKKGKDKTELLWAARFIDWKHPEMVIGLASNLKKLGYHFHITMIGGGAMEDEVKTLIQALGVEDCVTLAGFKTPDEVREYMKKADIYLVTSDRQEGWGAVVNEAMNSGCAVVGDAMIGAVPYLIENEGDGLIYKTKDLKSLTTQVQKLLDDEEFMQNMGRNAYVKIADTWNAQVATKRLCEFIDDVLAGKVDMNKWSDGPLSRA